MSMPSGRVIDLSHQLSADTPPFPGDPPIDIEIFDSTDRPPDASGKRHTNCSRFRMCIHCGTHLDAPFHFIAGGRTIDQVSLDVCVGPALLVDLRGKIDRIIERSHLEPWGARMSQFKRVVFRTGWEARWLKPDYFKLHPVFTGEAAQFLVKQGCVLVGVDFPSVDQDPYPAHLELLGNGVVILENLTNLDAIQSDAFWLSATPLKLLDRDGSPVRAVAIV